MEIIKNHKVAVIILLVVFAPTSHILFNALGIVSGFVNWGVATLIGMVFAIRWAYPRMRDFASEALAEDNNGRDDWWN